MFIINAVIHNLLFVYLFTITLTKSTSYTTKICRLSANEKEANFGCTRFISQSLLTDSINQISTHFQFVDDEDISNDLSCKNRYISFQSTLPQSKVTMSNDGTLINPPQLIAECNGACNIQHPLDSSIKSAVITVITDKYSDKDILTDFVLKLSIQCADHHHHDHIHSASSSRSILQAGTDCLEVATSPILSSDDPNYLVSDSGCFFARIESNGQLVIYESGLNARDEVARIGPDSGEGEYRLELLANNVLRIVDTSDNSVVWFADNPADSTNPGLAKLVMQNDGNLVLYEDSGALTNDLWDSETPRLSFEDTSNYATAQTTCAEFGLFTIRNEDDLKTLRTVAAELSITGMVWTGVNDLDPEDDNWSFDDGSCCVESLTDCQDLDWWATGEPANNPNQDCADFNLGESDNMEAMESQSCMATRQVVCNARGVVDADCSTDTPTDNPVTSSPSTTPSVAPSSSPSTAPSVSPTMPSDAPSTAPTGQTSEPSQAPSQSPTAPTDVPSAAPTVTPTTPSEAPSTAPTGQTSDPSQAPSQSPTAPTDVPSAAPTTPTNIPSSSPSASPTVPSVAPTTPSVAPTTPSVAPTTPSLAPTAATNGPTAATSGPTMAQPLIMPSSSPSSAPTPCTQSDLWPILSFIFPDNIACNILFELLPGSILDLLVPLYRDRICLALRLFDLTDEQLAEFLRLLQTTLDELDCDNIDISGSIPGIGSGSESLESLESSEVGGGVSSVSIPSIISSVSTSGSVSDSS